MTNDPVIHMSCPSCKGRAFEIDFEDGAILLLPNGKVFIRCVGCGSRWYGTLMIDSGKLEPSCYDEGRQA
jgi:hypothetical protein